MQKGVNNILYDKIRKININEAAMLDTLSIIPSNSQKEDVGIWIADIELPYNFRGFAVTYNNKIHILAGNISGTYTNHYAFDGTTWTQVSTLPYEFWGDAIVYNDKIHILGGPRLAAKKHYSFDGLIWAEVSPLPFDNASNAVIYNNKIHAFFDSSKKHYLYNGTSWTQVSTLPSGFDRPSVIVYNDKINALGGYGALSGSGGHIWHHVFNGSSWTKVATPLPCSSVSGGYMKSVVYKDRLHLITNYSSQDCLHLIYDGSKWITGMNLPYSPFDSSVVVYNDKIHILGGGTVNGTQDHYIYNDEISTTYTIRQFKLPKSDILIYCNGEIITTDVSSISSNVYTTTSSSSIFMIKSINEDSIYISIYDPDGYILYAKPRIISDDSENYTVEYYLTKGTLVNDEPVVTEGLTQIELPAVISCKGNAKPHS